MATVTEPVRGDTPSLNPYVPRILLRHLEEQPDELCWTTEGSVVFVDISGFTKLSEKLAKVGKEGAEQVTDAIEACFTDLLSVAYANGGSLIKFGGDALLLFFEEEDHVASACRSAIWMRRALRDVGRIELPGGAHLQLRMSVGAHTGTYHFFHVGGSHRELVVSGPGWTGTVAMEHVADAGEILLSPEIAAKLPPRCIGNPKGPGFLLKREPPGHHTAVEAPSYGVDPDAVARCLSTAVRGHVLAGGGTAEHRQVSIAFVHFDGTDDAIASRGPDAVAADLQDLLSDVQAACDEYGVCFLGSDADDNGGKLILTAGAPTITGNDEERMLLTVRKIADKERAIPIRIGVNRGAVFAGDIGPWYRRTYTVMGDAVNLAARLMAKATAGQIFASADVLDASGTLFTTIELEPFMVKGKAKPVQAWAMGEVQGSRTRDARVQLPLIGRDEELTQLRDALADARGGQGSLVEIVGEPGIGKSRLIEELHAELEARVLLATAEAFTSSTPYVIWRQLLRDLLEVGWEADDATVIQKLQAIVIDRDPALVPWIPLIGIPLDVDIPLTREVEQLAEEFRQPKLHEVMGRFLQLTMADETLLHVEDAHLMDGSSAELFAYLLGQIGESRWLVTVTRRQEDTGFVAPGHDRVRVIALEPLPRNEVVTLVEAATEEMPLLPHDVSLVADRAGGNPQFALDLAQVVASGGMLPESIETAAMARIDALAPADRDLVRRTSVLGTSFALRFLPDVLDKDAPSPDNETWKRLGEFFTDDEEGYIRFRRAVVRDAAYTGLPFRTRRSLHARIATRFETEYNPEETGGLLSLHYFLAGSYEEAWGYARTAAVRAADQFANQEAAQLFRRAIDAARRLTDVGPPELAEVYESMARSYLKASEFTAASDAFMAARRHFDGDPIAQARMLHERSKIEETLGRSAQALRWASKAKTMIRDLEAPEALRLAARVSAWYATLLQGLGRLDKADAWCRKAIDEARRSEDLLALAQADYVLGRSALMRGGSGTSLMEEALRIYRQIGDQAGEAQMLVNVGAARYFAGDWSGARAAWVQASELYQVMGDEPSAATGDMNISQVLIDQGRPDEAEPLLRRCVRRFRASGETYALGGSLAQLGRVLARLGRVDDALDVLGDAVTVHDGGGYQAEVLEDESLMAEALVMNERPTEALDRADSAIAAIEKLGGDHVSSSLLQRIRGEAFMQSANWDSARAAFEKSLDIARDRESDFDLGLTLIAMSRLARLTTNDDVAVLERETLEIVQRFEIVAVPTWPVAIAGR